MLSESISEYLCLGMKPCLGEHTRGPPYDYAMIPTKLQLVLKSNEIVVLLIRVMRHPLSGTTLDSRRIKSRKGEYSTINPYFQGPLPGSARSPRWYRMADHRKDPSHDRNRMGRVFPHLGCYVRVIPLDYAPAWGPPVSPFLQVGSHSGILS
jgi:hypothetical protein